MAKKAEAYPSSCAKHLPNNASKTQTVRFLRILKSNFTLFHIFGEFTFKSLI